MLFNSLAFALFLPLVFGLYWGLQRRPLWAQNTLLLASSYVFYGWWDWRFLGLIVISSAVDYLVGVQLGKAGRSERSRRLLLTLSVAVNLGILGFFKYFNFFIESLAIGLSSIGFEPNLPLLRVILPVGISFYTFQTMSYTIDVYRRQMEPTRDALAFFAYVSFFPQLVAGPIERAKSLLPQFLVRRQFEWAEAKDGARHMLWGLFKKVVIADNLAPYVDAVYGSWETASGAELFLGTLFFALQIYCDFSGYSDIAIGCARLFGFRLMRNFAYPYFSRDIGEFWRRWHISLSSWFRDYVYIPLGGSRTGSRAHHLFNLIATFTISGFWHGANWTFVVWGFLNGLYYLPLVLSGRNKQHMGTVAEGRLLPSLQETRKMLGTFGLALLAWVFFRAESVGAALSIITGTFSRSWLDTGGLAWGLIYVVIVLVAEWFQRDKEHFLQVAHLSRVQRWVLYYAVVTAIVFFRQENAASFIYFQF
ncbi:MAG: MBOAT family O-acyltransferase [Bacteroidota bacterium]